MGGPSRSLGTDPTIARDSVDGAALPPDETLLTEGTMVGEYRIEGVLGAGGMGRVYSAVHPVIGKRAAVKVLHPALSVERDAVERFIQEARAVNQIGHPNIVDIFAFGNLTDGRCYFVMEQLRGESLGERIERERCALLDALTILDAIAIALEAAHRKGIVHRDLKPDNVFLVEVEGSQPQVKLLDFGIAKLVGGDTPLHRTRTGNVMGTPAYISPEQARGQGVDHRTDIYAFGAVAFEMLTGRWPFPANNAADMIAKHLFEAPPSAAELNPEVDGELDALIKRMLAKDVSERPTLEEARAQLRACRNRAHQRQALHEGGHTDPVVDISRVRPRTNDDLALSIPIDPPGVRSHRKLVVGIVAIVVAVVAVVLVLRGRGDKPEERAVTAPVDAQQRAASPPAPAPAPAPPAPVPADAAIAAPVPDAAITPAATKPAKPSRPAKRKPKQPGPKEPIRVDDPDAPM